ncbi:MAG TPA: hypothetical protein VMD75_16010 [Candidatus Binataceae bacterium]|nr:hypothetical protein [Candidatus Binataceae bacterium]
MKTTGERGKRRGTGAIIRGFLWTAGLVLILATAMEMMSPRSSDRFDSDLSEVPQQNASGISRPVAQPPESVSEICDHYSKFHNNPKAYEAAENRAKIYECAVLQTQFVSWRQYDSGDPRANAKIDAAKKKARALLEKRYPKIPDDCADALLALGYVVIAAENPTSKAQCPRAEMADEDDTSP